MKALFFCSRFFCSRFAVRSAGLRVDSISLSRRPQGGGYRAGRRERL
jgi:hypothetical protein